MHNTLISLDDDKKELVIKEIKEFYLSIKFLLEGIENDSLSINTKDCISNLSKNYFLYISNYLNYKTVLKENHENDEIKDMLKKIHVLKDTLSNNINVENIKQISCNVEEKLDNWWSNEGFGYCINVCITDKGVECLFNLDINNIMNFFDNNSVPENFDLINICNNKYLLDTSKNRNQIFNILKNKFKSIEIKSYENKNIFDTEDFQLLNVQCIIKDLNDLNTIF